jgi:putative SOS response-associated peptidase YedK
MPLVLPASEWAAWLDPRVDPAPMLGPPPDELVAAIERRPVGPQVGNVANDDPGLIAQVAQLTEPVEQPTLL